MPDQNLPDLQRDWDFQVNLSGLQAPTGKGGNALPTGYYQVKLIDLYINPARNPNRVVIKVQVKEGPFAGAVRTTGFRRPTSHDDKVRYYWRGLAESAGYTPTELDAGEVKLSAGLFMGKEAHIFFTEKDEANGQKWEEIDFLPPAAWAQQAASFEMRQAAETHKTNNGSGQSSSQGSALGGGAAPITPASRLGGGGDGSGSLNNSSASRKSDLRARLGMGAAS